MGKDLQGRDLVRKNRNQKAFIIISAGIGDAVVMVPFLKRLSLSGFQITIILNSKFINEDFLIFNQFPFDDLIQVDNSFQNFKILRLFRHFEYAFLDYSSSSIKNILFSKILSKNVIAFRKTKIPFLNIEYRNEIINTHVAILAIQLYQKEFNESDFDFSTFRLKPKNTNKADIIKQIDSIGKIPVVIQASSANLTAPYKNWPINYWIQFLNSISENYPDFYFILLGDENEMAVGEELQNALQCPIANLIGKTDLTEMCELLFNSKMYIGLDSGLMHLAVAYDIPTFSVFGASSYEFVGYEKFDNIKHKVVYNPLNCWPCHGFSRTNQSKVKKPSHCPDIECLIKLKPDKVYEDFIRFYEALFLNQK